VCGFRRLHILNSVTLLCVVAVIPQASAAPGKEADLYSMALSASISEMQKSWGQIDDSFGNRIRTDYSHIAVRQNPEITEGLPIVFGDHHVEYLDDRALIDRYKAQRKGFSVLEIHPMHNVGTLLDIQVSVSWIKYEKGRLILLFSDWSDVELRYDCEKQAYTVSSVKLGGI
jgi:hypothetical protein